MRYISTRGDNERLIASEAIIRGIAPDKGLYVPETLPKLPFVPEDMAGACYSDVAERILAEFFDDFTSGELNKLVTSAYDDKFDTPEIVPLVKAGDAFFLELFHGKTCAFKDMALSILPLLMTESAKKLNEKHRICILTATSGDTGKAALAGFEDVPGTEIVVFYPKSGVSEVQERQMVTQTGANTHVFGINGNFDDAQTAVKHAFRDERFCKDLEKDGIKLSSANSINIGRLVPQIVYYVYSYIKLLEHREISPGDSINIVVPTGNFGNILAAYYAKEAGLPVNKLICASNKNNILTDFFKSGVYDTNREFYLTNSPSMDILISSNLERLLYHLSGNSPDIVKELMEKLEMDRKYEVDDEIKNGLSDFYAGFAGIEETVETIGNMYEQNKYLIDTHTAVAYKVYEDYRKETGDGTPTVIASTASPFKFARSVAEAIDIPDSGNGFDQIRAVSDATGIEVPKGLEDLDKKKVLHNMTISRSEIEDAVRSALGV